MNLRTVLIASISALFGMCLALMVVSSTAAQILPGRHENGIGPLAPHWGRYQIALSNNNVFLTDSATGECWTPANGHWQRVAPPISESKQ
jgi:hypothetical protein